MYRYSGQRCVRKDLIEKELSQIQGAHFKEQKLSKRFIDCLFRHYRTAEFSIHFYDSEPDLRDDIDVDDPWWESPEGDEYLRQRFRENEERRMTFNNWVDLYTEGNWGLSQLAVDNDAREAIKSVRNWPVKKKGRIYCGTNEKYLMLYCYGRDFKGVDYWLAMRRRRQGGSENDVSF